MKKMKKLLALLAVLVMTLCAPVQAAKCPLAGQPMRAAKEPVQAAERQTPTAGLYCFRVAPGAETVWSAWKICVPCQTDGKSDPSCANNNQPCANANQPNVNNNQPGASANRPNVNNNQPGASANRPNANNNQSGTNANRPNANGNSQANGSQIDANAAGIHAYEAEVIRLVNEIRVQNGLNALTTDTELCRGARAKSQDMADNRYFDHNSPVYGTPFQMMKSFGITYRTAGENIAYGYAAPQTVMDGWMNSSGHRANILNAAYTRIGVGYVANGNYWTQWFAG